MKTKPEVFVLSSLELERVEVLRRVAERRLTQRKAAEILGLTTRQVRRLQAVLEAEGPQGLGSRKRGMVGNHRHPPEFRERVIELVRSNYWDFGPTLAREKLAEIDGILVGKETLRGWLMEAGVWVTRERRLHIHQPRERRECFGELVQIDGSPHKWFENRGPKSTLLVFVDDATGRLMVLRFVESETAFDYFDASRVYLERYGKPVAFYSDKHSIFRAVTRGHGEKATGQTQFGRALGQLNIDIICANTPQAKGRVERANRTLQDRLVKELRLRGISDMESANAYAPVFMDDFNSRFARAPRDARDVHRPVRENEDLHSIFALQSQRTISKDLVVHYNRKKYIINADTATKRLAKKTCTVYEWTNGTVDIRVGKQTLPYRVFDKNPLVSRAAIVENKLLSGVLEKIRQEQDVRDEGRLARASLSLRKKARIRMLREDSR